MFYYVRKFKEDLDFLWERFKKRLEEEGFLIIGERIPVAIVEREEGAHEAIRPTHSP